MDRPNVVVLVFDTLRPDYLSCYDGGPDIPTPGFERLTDRGTVFDRAFSAGPNTEVSHGALFTGRYPSDTGLVGGPVEIPDGETLLAEHFRDHGYATFGVSGPSKIRSDLGYDRGFETYVEPYYDNLDPRPSAAYLRRAATDRLVGRDFCRTLTRGPDSLTAYKFDLLKRRFSRVDDRPLFAFVNVLTCHTPYDPPRPYKERAVESLSRPRWFTLEYALEQFGFRPETLDDPAVRSERVLRAAGGHGGPYFGDPSWLTDRELVALRDLYAATVRYLDARVDAFLDWLDETGLASETVLVCTADHGEHLGEHDLLYHGNFLYDETLHVPLFVSGPDVPADRREAFVSLVDVFPTLCERAGVETPPDLRGESLLGGAGREAVFAEYGTRDATASKFAAQFDDEQRTRFSLGMKCVRTRDRKLVLRSDGTVELFGVPGDEPIADVDDRIADADAPMADDDATAPLRERLTDTLGVEFDPAGDAREGADDRVLANLRELGYVD